MLEHVGIGNPAERIRAYPHELSGGMKQRVLIAMPIIGKPDLLIADEPTTALDVSVQADVLNLLHRLQDELGLTYLFISHDLGVVRYVCHEVAVILCGELVEQGPVESIFDAQQNGYARKLLAALPNSYSEFSPLSATMPG